MSTQPHYTCIICGAVRECRPYKVTTAKYCSHACRLAGLHAKTKADRKKPEATCKQCGANFRASPSAHAKYCSRPCYDIAQRLTPEDVFTRVNKNGGPDSCWPWLGSVSVWGYGSTTLRGIGHNAHRVAYIATHGSIPKNVVVMHKCDNRLCCNPAHLEAGTQKQNIADMDAKGRRGKRNHVTPPRQRSQA